MGCVFIIKFMKFKDPPQAFSQKSGPRLFLLPKVASLQSKRLPLMKPTLFPGHK